MSRKEGCHNRFLGRYRRRSSVGARARHQSYVEIAAWIVSTSSRQENRLLGAKGCWMSTARRVAALCAAVLALVPAVAQAGPALWVDALPAPDQAISYMSAFPSGDAFVYFHNRPGEIQVSEDFGMTWSPRPGPAGGATAFEMASPQVGYSANQSELSRTDDGSQSWTSLPNPKLPGRPFEPGLLDWQKGWDLKVQTIAVTAAEDRFSIGGELTHMTRRHNESATRSCYSGKSWAALLFSDDGGRSGKYRIHRFGFSGFVRRHGWLNKKIGWALVRPWNERSECGKAATSDSFVYITRDGGYTYDRIYTCPCMSVAMASPSRIVVGRSDGWLYLSKNGGDGFEPQRYIGNPGAEGVHFWWVNGIAFADAKTGYAVAQGGGVHRTDDGGETWDLEPSSQNLGGFAFGDLAVADAEHAIAGGPNSIIARQPLP